MTTITENYTVYMHIFPNGKRYVGITGQKLKDRWRVNGNGYRPQKLVYRAIQKYGWDNIEHIVIAENLSAFDAGELEKSIIAKYNTTDFRYGYNQSVGGENSPIGVKRSDETRKRLSQSHLGQKCWNKGKHLSDETKEKLRNVNLGKILDESVKRKISTKNKGIKPSALAISNATKSCSKAVIRICDNAYFKSATIASSQTGVPLNTITRHCRNEVKKPRWKYVK